MKKRIGILMIFCAIFSVYGCDSGPSGAVPESNQNMVIEQTGTEGNTDLTISLNGPTKLGKLKKGGGDPGVDMDIDILDEITIPAEWDEFVTWRKGQVQYVETSVSPVYDSTITYSRKEGLINGLCQATFDLPYPEEYSAAINAWRTVHDGIPVAEFTGAFGFNLVSEDAVNYFEFDLSPTEIVPVPCVIDAKGTAADYQNSEYCGCDVNGNLIFWVQIKNQLDPETWNFKFYEIANALYRDGKLHFVIGVSQYFILQAPGMFPTPNKGLSLLINGFDYDLSFEPTEPYRLMNSQDGYLHLQSVATATATVGYTTK